MSTSKNEIDKIKNEIDRLMEEFSSSSTDETNETVEVSSGDSTIAETVNEVLVSVVDSGFLTLISALIILPIILKIIYTVLVGSFFPDSSEPVSSLDSSEEKFSPRVKEPLPDSHKVDKSIAGSQEVIERYNLLLNSYTGIHTSPKRYEIMITAPALLDLNVLPTKRMDEAIISLMNYADSVLPNCVTEPSKLVTDTDVDNNNALVTEMSSRIDKAEELWIKAEQHAAVVGIPNTSSTHYELGKKLINQLTGSGVTDNERVSAWNSLKDLAIKMGVSENVVSGTQEYTHELIPVTRMAIES